MKRSSLLGYLGLTSLAALTFWGTLCPAAEEQITFRDLVRRYYADKADPALGKVVGLAQPVKHVVALDYTILLKSADGEKAVDPKSHRFQLNDSIRIRIQPLADTYVYIFHEGASGQRVCLVPVEQEDVPFIKANESLDLPGDGYFEFVAPPGSERLLVVATERPIADLALLSNVVFKKPGEQLTPEEQAIKDSFQATVNKTLESIRERQNSTMSFRGLPASRKERNQFAQKVQQAGATQVVIEEPPHGSVGGTLALAASSGDAPNLYVTIALQSIGG